MSYIVQHCYACGLILEIVGSCWKLINKTVFNLATFLELVKHFTNLNVSTHSVIYWYYIKFIPQYWTGNEWKWKTAVKKILVKHLSSFRVRTPQSHLVQNRLRCYTCIYCMILRRAEWITIRNQGQHSK